MPTPRSFDGGKLPTHMRKVEGADRSWVERAKCKTNTQGGRPGFAWTVDRRDGRIQGLKAERWVALAVTICKACDAQYDCARFAIQVEERWHTWGMDIEDLKWLQRRADAGAIIDAAEDVGVPVSDAVVSIRARMT